MKTKEMKCSFVCCRCEEEYDFDKLYDHTACEADQLCIDCADDIVCDLQMERQLLNQSGEWELL